MEGAAMQYLNNLPTGFLSQEVHLACETDNWKEIVQFLQESAPNEACIFVLAHPSRGQSRTTVILHEIIWPQPGEVIATPNSLEIGADYITRAMDAAVDAGDLVGVVLVHIHPETEYGKGVGKFSMRDDWYEQRLFPSITLQRPKAISGSIVIGSDSRDIDARIWWDDGSGLRTQAAQIMRIVGPEISFLETSSSLWKDHPDPDVMDRSTRLWGIQGTSKTSKRSGWNCWRRRYWQYNSALVGNYRCRQNSSLR